jgi:tripartite-type tricarboxylate transporter receptor subunit TctC
MKSLSRRDFLAASAGLALGPAAFALETYPSRPVQFVHGFGAGGNADVVSRLLAKKLQDLLRQPFIVDIKSGGGGAIATDFVAKAKPDGYSLLMMTGAHTVSAAVKRNLPYDPVKDFAFISTVTSFPFVVAVRADHPARTLRELLAFAAKQPERVTFTSVGVGSTQHMVGELMASAAKVKLLHIPYRGGGAPVSAVISGEVDVLADTVTVAAPHIKSGRLRVLAVTSERPWPSLPGVPTVASELPGFEITSWLGVAAPAGVSGTVVDVLNKAVRTALGQADTKETLAGLGSVASPSSASEMRAMVEREISRWRAAVARASIPLQ